LVGAPDSFDSLKPTLSTSLAGHSLSHLPNLSFSLSFFLHPSLSRQPGLGETQEFPHFLLQLVFADISLKSALHHREHHLMDFLQTLDTQILVGAAVALVAIGAGAVYFYSSRKPKGVNLLL
jgi:hypothetical protein